MRFECGMPSRVGQTVTCSCSRSINFFCFNIVFSRVQQNIIQRSHLASLDTQLTHTQMSKGLFGGMLVRRHLTHVL